MTANTNVPVAESVGGTQLPGGKRWARATDGDSGNTPPPGVAVCATRPLGQVLPQTLAERDVPATP